MFLNVVILLLLFVCPCLAIGWLYIPMLNIPIVLATFPLFTLFPSFGETGVHMVWDHSGPLPQSTTAFVALYVYYWIIGFLFFGILFYMYRKSERKEKRPQGK